PSSRPPSSWLARVRFSADIRSNRPQRAFLQQRLALFGKVLTGFLLLGLLVQIFTEIQGDPFGPISRILAVSAAFPAVLWLMCRRGKLSYRALRLVEAVSLFGTALCIAVMGRYLHVALLSPGGGLIQASLDPGPVVAATENHVSTAVALGLSYAVVLRAALVPTRPRYTFGLTVALGLPVALVWMADAARFGAPHLTLIGQQYVQSTAVRSSAGWWFMTCVVCTVISSIIFGLRREVAQARRLGQYTLVQKLGEGGMGSVYRAQHAMMQRPTAIKVLAREQATNQQIERFEREVQLTTRLTHPNTITIFDFGRTDQGEFYYVMELLAGATLDEIVAVSHDQPPERVVHVMSQVAAALVEAHDLGLIHRDIKPSNVFLSSLGGKPDVVKLCDFGLVKQLSQKDSAELTGDRTITGTPLYMPPEAITAPKSVDERSDLYSLGALGYYLLTGEHVFDGATTVEVCGHHLHSKPTPPADRLGRHVPEDLEQLLLALLAKDPAERPQSAQALLERLSACDSYGRWTDPRALEWWEENEAAILRLRGRPVATRGLTLAKALDAP
ncbi:MAG: protein kinase, partial [Deltaproteobacteria bacterium]|nr:protein kinase [Deltaproteobacteria bacterium]MBW2532878.1 protein kinase [Deltaproteobacteria bacterium]